MGFWSLVRVIERLVFGLYTYEDGGIHVIMGKKFIFLKPNTRNKINITLMTLMLYRGSNPSPCKQTWAANALACFLLGLETEGW